MKTARLEAFSDGVIAIIITIMVLELKVPEHLTPETLGAMWPIVFSYALSFVLVAIYWVNHHNLLHFAKTASRGMLWTNIHWLFWLSLIPFTTAAIGHHPHDPFTMNVYGVVQLACALSYRALMGQVLTPANMSPDMQTWHRVLRKKGMLSTALYVAAIPLAWIHPSWSVGIYVGVAIAFIVPSKNFEKFLGQA
jgi:uncharacterized membrane protein